MLLQQVFRRRSGRTWFVRATASVVAVVTSALPSACTRSRVTSAAPTAAAAPTTLPLPLVRALLNDRMNATTGGPQFYVGTLPPGFPAALVPPGPVQVIGSVHTEREMVIVLADSTRRLADVVVSNAMQNGYQRPPTAMGRGFANTIEASGYLCGDNAMLNVAQLTGQERHVAKLYVSFGQSGACVPSAPYRMMQSDTTILALPSLTPPPGAHVSSGGGGRGRDGVDARAVVTQTSLSIEAVLAHYAAQLVAARWSADTPGLSQRAAVQYFEAADATGARWNGLLTATATNNTITVTLSMKRSNNS
ncbi:MAG: hypothetical protein IT353_07595 [Gemmatimonadaceae bacterium]|nr:hypothetical protein [Gemmatimonadaceae bacterium]